MSRRKSGVDFGTIMLGIVCAIIFSIAKAVTSIKDSLGLPTFVALIVGGLVLIIWWRWAAKRKKKRLLLSKYGDPQIVDDIYNHRFWQGQTAEQLLDSLGSPHGVDRKLLKTMKREVWKYSPRGVNRYGLRITVDDDIVSGWDQKQ